MLNDDYKEMLQCLSAHGVRFLVVGAYAMGAYGYPRATGDLDLWVESSPENAEHVYLAISDFGAPMDEIDRQTFTEPGIVFQIGMAPRRIDLLTHIDGVDFNEAYQAREEIQLGGLTIPFLSKDHIIQNKKSTGRKKDELDVEYLEGPSPTQEGKNQN